MSVLSDFILLGSDRVGSFALGSSKIDLWTMAVDAICKSVAEVVNQHAIPKLLKYNGMKFDDAPELKYSEVAHIDLTEISDYVSKLTAAGAISPDAEMEDFLRGLAGLPMATGEPREQPEPEEKPETEEAPEKEEPEEKE